MARWSYYSRTVDEHASDAAAAASLLHVSYLNAGSRTRVSVYPSGIVVAPPVIPTAIGPGGIRSPITGFSKASRRRLKRKLVALDFRKDHWHFITLTYPGEFGYDPERWKSHLNAFRSALLRDWGEIFRGLIWRLEQQDRGAPHYHMLSCWQKRLPVKLFRTWVRQTWTRILKELPRVSKWVRSEVKPVRITGDQGIPKLLHYLAKYLGKVSPGGWLIPATGELLAPGRLWGEWGDLPYAQPETHEFEPEEVEQLVCRIRWTFTSSKYLSQLDVDRFQGVFWGDPDLWRRLIADLPHVAKPP